jgi:hypothetical protein
MHIHFKCEIINYSFVFFILQTISTRATTRKRSWNLERRAASNNNEENQFCLSPGGDGDAGGSKEISTIQDEVSNAIYKQIEIQAPEHKRKEIAILYFVLYTICTIINIKCDYIILVQYTHAAFE